MGKNKSSWVTYPRPQGGGSPDQSLLQSFEVLHHLLPTPPNTLPGVTATAVALGYYHTCAIVTGGAVKCWGNNGYGQLGDGGTTDKYGPVDVSLGSGLLSIK